MASFSQLPHLGIIEGYIPGRSEATGTKQSDTARREGTIMHSRNVLLIDVQVHIIATRYHRKQIGLIQPGFHGWTRSKAQCCTLESTSNGSKLIVSLDTGGKSVEAGLSNIGTNKKAAPHAASNGHLYLKGKIAQPGAIGVTFYVEGFVGQLSMKSPIGKETTVVP